MYWWCVGGSVQGNLDLSQFVVNLTRKLSTIWRSSMSSTVVQKSCWIHSQGWFTHQSFDEVIFPDRHSFNRVAHVCLYGNK